MVIRSWEARPAPSSAQQGQLLGGPGRIHLREHLLSPGSQLRARGPTARGLPGDLSGVLAWPSSCCSALTSHLHWVPLWETGRNHCEAKGAPDSPAGVTGGREEPDRGVGASGQSRLPTPLLHGLASTSRGHAEPHLPTVLCGGGCSTSRIWELTVNSCYKFTRK